MQAQLRAAEVLARGDVAQHDAQPQEREGWLRTCGASLT